MIQQPEEGTAPMVLSPSLLDEEIDGLYEDLLNWDCGHPMDDNAPVDQRLDPRLRRML